MTLSGKRLFLTIWGTLFVAIILAIVYVSAQVKGLEKQIIIDTKIVDIEQDIRTSQTEWAFLTNPAIAEIGKVLPELQKITAKNIMDLENVPTSTKYIDVTVQDADNGAVIL